MKRILYLGIVLTTLLMASNAFCGTDDSGLQVFTLNGADMMGETADVGQEDTKISQYSLNMFQSGNSLTVPVRSNSDYSYTQNYGSETLYYADMTNLQTLNFSSALITRISTGGFDANVYLHSSPGSSPVYDVITLLTSTAYTPWVSEIFAYNSGGTECVFLGKKIIALTGTASSPTTTEVVLTSFSLAAQPCTNAAIWSNRLFMAYGNYLIFSAAQDFSNFTNSATAGGTIRLYESSYILKMVSTRYGLYIFTSDGIYLQTGTGSKTTWEISKISNIVSNTAISYNDVIYFIETSNRLYVISGTQVATLAEIPPNFPVIYGKMQMGFSAGGKFLIMANPSYSNKSFVFDIDKKSFHRSDEYNALSAKYSMKKTATTYQIFPIPYFGKGDTAYNPFDTSPVVFMPWSYTTAWLTLDGNAGNRKEIDRIEIDYQGGTTAVSLGWAYGNGSYSTASTYLYSPAQARHNTYVWNSPAGKQQSNRFYLKLESYGTQTMTTNYILKQIRIYYRNIGNYKTNALR